MPKNLAEGLGPKLDWLNKNYKPQTNFLCAPGFSTTNDSRLRKLKETCMKKLETLGFEAPAVSVARSMRAVGKACPSLVGNRAGPCDQNATRDVTHILAKSGMALHVKRDKLAPRRMVDPKKSLLCFKMF